ncbi:MCE family protein [Rhodococcus sp. USK13]|uniref:MCE family protein n=1 Tax=Rhodococcus sp. USK13 TaxID=2806442 RepID=UPI001BCEAFEB|nr:MCE family protein [Rhodococcus sp. USK13]
MKITGTVVKFSIFAIVMLLISFALVVVFGQVRFDSRTGYTAQFTNVSGLRPGQFVRIAGVEVGKVDDVVVVDNSRAAVRFSINDGVRLTTSAHATVRWENLIGDHYLELLDGSGPSSPLQPGGQIPLTNTSPGLDLDALIGGFRPLFKALDPDQVNRLSSSLVSALQGQGGTISNVLTQTAQLTATLADRDELIGSVITNLNNVLRTVDENSHGFDQGIDQLQQLISGLSRTADPIGDALVHVNDASGTVAALLGDTRPDIQGDIAELGRVSDQINSDSAYLDDLFGRLPDIYAHLTRLGQYGDFFGFYLCDANLKVNGPDGNPVYIKLVGQRAGRCQP